MAIGECMRGVEEVGVDEFVVDRHEGERAGGGRKRERDW